MLPCRFSIFKLLSSDCVLFKIAPNIAVRLASSHLVLLKSSVRSSKRRSSVILQKSTKVLYPSKSLLILCGNSKRIFIPPNELFAGFQYRGHQQFLPHIVYIHLLKKEAKLFPGKPQLIPDQSPLLNSLQACSSPLRLG